MSCDLEALEAYALDELSDARASAVAAHARACPGCGEELRQLRLERAALSARARLLDQVPPPFAAVLERSLRPAPPPPRLAGRAPAWAAALSAAAAALLVSLATPVRTSGGPAGSEAVCVSWSSPPPAGAASWEDDAIATEEHTYAACLLATPGSEHEHELPVCL